MAERLQRREAAMNRLRRHARQRRISLTKLIKMYLPGWPKATGPNLTVARAEAIADRLDASATPTHNSQHSLGKEM